MSTRKQRWIQMALVTGCLILVGLLSSRFYTRIDLTADKRYSLSPSTIQFLKNLDDQVYIRVYLTGNLPSGLKQLEASTRDVLNGFQSYAKGRLDFRFIDIYDYELEARKELSKELYEYGIKPTTSVNVIDGSREEMLLFPGAVVSYKGREMGVQLLPNQVGYDEARRLNNAIVQLEYLFAQAIQKLSQYRRPVVGLSRGHGEMPLEQLASLGSLLEENYYEIKPIDLREGVNVPKTIDVLLIAGPTKPFTEAEKFKIDQYIMNGGKVLWAIDPMVASMDSMQESAFFMSMPRDVNLGDMLFKYGIRLNDDLIQDAQLQAPVPLVSGQVNGVPQTQLFPMIYQPLLIPGSQHGIVRNLDPVWGRFTSTLDTIRVSGIKKHTLLVSSEFSRAPKAPVRVHVSQFTSEIEPKAFGQSFLPAAVSLEGTFRSIFEHRKAQFQPGFLESMDSLGAFTFRDSVVDNKMIVIADADILRNDLSESGKPYVLGYNRYSRTQYANATFVQNCIEYLLDRNNLIETRNKDIVLRRLDGVKAKESKNRMIFLNIGLPLLFIFLVGLVYNRVRKYKFGK